MTFIRSARVVNNVCLKLRKPYINTSADRRKWSTILNYYLFKNGDLVEETSVEVGISQMSSVPRKTPLQWAIQCFSGVQDTILPQTIPVFVTRTSSKCQINFIY